MRIWEIEIKIFVWEKFNFFRLISESEKICALNFTNFYLILHSL